MLVMTPEEHITPVHLPSNILSQAGSHGHKVALDETIPFSKAIESVERQIIERALKKYGSTRKAAKALEIRSVHSSSKSQKTWAFRLESRGGRTGKPF